MHILDRFLSSVVPLIDTAGIAQATVELSQIERPTDFDSFARSADYLNQRFLSIGAESEILHFPADGKTRYHCWTAPIGFRTTRAVCSIIEPKDCTRVLGDRTVEPNTAVVGTGHTGAEGIEAEVVHVKQSMDISEADVRDKIVYCSDLEPHLIRQQIIERRGKAIVSSFVQDRAENTTYVKWVNTWDSQADGWLPTAKAAAENLPGISISPEMGDYLEECLAKGPVKLRIITQGEYFESELLGVSTILKGEDDGLVLLTGHLFEQGLVDNAAGVTVGFAVSEIVQELARKLKVDRFRRGLWNFHSQECYGVLALSKYHPKVIERAFAHLNVDMVGRMGAPLIMQPGLLASAGFSDFLLRLVLARAQEIVPACRYEFKNEFGINCSILAEPALGGISTSLLGQFGEGCPEWHTSRDRSGVLELDQDMIGFATLVVATWAVFLLTAGDQEARWLLAEYKKDVENTVGNGSVADTGIYLDLKQREMSSLAEIASPDQKAELLSEIREFVTDVKKRITNETVIVPAGTEQEVERAKQLCPKAIVGGPAVEECFTGEQLQDIGSPKWDHVQLILKSWADGNRSVYDITRLATFETGVPLSLGYTLAFFEHYAKQGIISLHELDGRP